MFLSQIVQRDNFLVDWERWTLLGVRGPSEVYFSVMIWFILPLSPHYSGIEYVFMCEVIFQSHRDPDSPITKEWHPFYMLFSSPDHCHFLSLSPFLSFSHPSISMLSLSLISLHLFSHSESMHTLCLSSFQMKQLNPQINVLSILSNSVNLFFMHLSWSQKGVSDVEKENRAREMSSVESEKHNWNAIHK